MSTTTRVIKNTGFLYAKMGISVFLSLYTTRLILASLGASDFGVFNIVGGAITMLGFLNSTMANATQRFMSFAEGEGNILKKKQIFNVSMILHIGVALLTGIILVIAMIPLFGGIFNIMPDRVYAAKVIYLSLIVSTMFTVINVPYDSVMNAHENMLYYALIGIFESILKLIVAFACVYTTSDKLIVYGVLMAVIPFITLSIMKWYCHRKYSECVFGFKKYWNSGLVKEIGLFSGWNLLTAVSSLASFYGTGLVLNHFFGTLLNAAQGVANQVNGQMSTFSVNLMKAVNPIIVKNAGAKDTDAMNKAVLASGKYSTLLLVFFAVPFCLEMHYILNIWLKDVPDWTSLFCCLQLAISIICQAANSAATSVYAQGNIKWYAIYKSTMNILPVVVTYIAFRQGASPYWLYISMIVIWAIGGDYVIIHYAKKCSGLTFYVFCKDVVAPICFVIVPMVLVGYLPQLFMEEDFLRLLVSCFATSIVFLISIWIIVFKKQERQNVVSFIKARL